MMEAPVARPGSLSLPGGIILGEQLVDTGAGPAPHGRSVDTLGPRRQPRLDDPLTPGVVEVHAGRHRAPLAPFGFVVEP